MVGSGEGFLAFLTAVAQTTPETPHLKPVERFLGRHAPARKFIEDAQPLPASFATLAYFGNNAWCRLNRACSRRPDGRGTLMRPQYAGGPLWNVGLCGRRPRPAADVHFVGRHTSDVAIRKTAP